MDYRSGRNGSSGSDNCGWSGVTNIIYCLGSNCLRYPNLNWLHNIWLIDVYHFFHNVYFDHLHDYIRSKIKLRPCSIRRILLLLLPPYWHANDHGRIVRRPSQVPHRRRQLHHGIAPPLHSLVTREKWGEMKCAVQWQVGGPINNCFEQRKNIEKKLNKSHLNHASKIEY